MITIIKQIPCPKALVLYHRPQTKFITQYEPSHKTFSFFKRIFK